ncbi:MAG: hypothetical protein AB1498_04490 [bacterium]
MRKLLYLVLFLISVHFFILSAVNAEDSTKSYNKIETGLFNIENILKNKIGPDENEGNVKLKMVTRIVAGAVLIVGILGTIAVQFKLISIGLGTVTERPETLGGLIILMLLPESIVLLSFIISTLLILL